MSSGRPGLPPTVGPGARKNGTVYFDERFEGGHRFSTTSGAAPWLVTDSAGAPTTRFVVVDVLGGGLELRCDGDDNDVSNHQTAEWFQLAAGRNFYVEMEVAPGDISAEELFVGLCIRDTTILAGATDLIGFYCQNNTDLFAVTRKNGSTSAELGSGTAATETVTDTGINLADSTYVRLNIDIEGTGKVKFYVDGALVATHKTNIPDDELLAASFEIRNDGGGGTDEEGLLWKSFTVGPIDRA